MTEPIRPAQAVRSRARRQRRLAVMRRLGLLPLLERISFLRERRRRAGENAAFAAKHDGLALPPLWWMHDMYAHTSWPLYWRSGQDHAQSLTERIETVLGKGEHAVAEWGCGMGRILRHLPPEWDVTGFDYNRAAVAWCAGNLPGRFSLNGDMPPLDAEDGAFDALYTVSVFTHLSAAQHEAWAKELARVIRPGGVLLATVHGRPEEGQLLPSERERFEAGRLVTRGGVKRGSRIYTAYHPRAFIERLFGDAFALRGEPEPALGQTLYTLTRRES